MAEHIVKRSQAHNLSCAPKMKPQTFAREMFLFSPFPAMAPGLPDDVVSQELEAPNLMVFDADLQAIGNWEQNLLVPFMNPQRLSTLSLTDVQAQGDDDSFRLLQSICCS